jgi:hypothetical protein
VCAGWRGQHTDQSGHGLCGEFIYNESTIFTGMIGVIDDFHIYNRITSVGEETALYNAGAAKHR